MVWWFECKIKIRVLKNFLRMSLSQYDTLMGVSRFVKKHMGKSLGIFYIEGSPHASVALWMLFDRFWIHACLVFLSVLYSFIQVSYFHPIFDSFLFSFAGHILFQQKLEFFVGFGSNTCLFHVMPEPKFVICKGIFHIDPPVSA